MSIEIKKHYASYSDALLAGAQIGGQCRHVLQDIDGNTCAIGGSLAAIFGDANLHVWDYPARIIEAFPYLLREGVLCPVVVNCPNYEGDTSHLSVIAHLNDVHGWSKEEIANFVRLYEDSIGYVTLIEEVKESAQELVTV